MDDNNRDNQSEKLTLKDAIFFFSISALPPIILAAIFVAVSFWVCPIPLENHQNVLMLSGLIGLFSVLLGVYFCKMKGSCFLGIILMIVIAAGLFSLPFVAGVSGRFKTIWLIGSVIFIIPLVFILWMLGKKFLADTKAVIDVFEITPGNLILGQTLDYRISVTPKTRIQPEKITLVLKCIEDIEENNNSKTNNIHIEEKVLSENEDFMPSVPRDYTGRFQIPEGGKPSLDADKHKINWTIEFKIRLKNWPDISMEKDLKVISKG